MNLSGAVISPLENSASGTRDIYLPNQGDHAAGFGFAIDLGGSLSKVVLLQRREGEHNNAGRRMHFEHFQTHSIGELIDFLRPLVEEGLSKGVSPVVKATGGGAHKYGKLFEDELGIRLEPEDEMMCLISGLNFLLREVSSEVFSCDANSGTLSQNFCEVRDPRTMFPYMLVNIGSGVSILKVTSETSFERVSGTSLGGGTLWGLLSLLTDCKDFDQMLEMSSRGDNRNVDMLVGDIYGSDYPSIGLKASTIASSFGKVWQKNDSNKRPAANQEDICKSALLMVSNNIGQIAYLNARYYNINTIYFGGSFIRGHADTMRTISYGVDFWSKGEMKALFLRHDGFLGCLGALLAGEDTVSSKQYGSFMENFSRSRSVSAQPVHYFGVLDSMPELLVPFPLLSKPSEYVSSTVSLESPELREQWLDIFTETITQVTSAVRSCMQSLPNIDSKLKAFSTVYGDILGRIRLQPGAYGTLSVPLLLRLQEQCMQEFISHDAVVELKTRLNDRALEVLPLVLSAYDKISDRTVEARAAVSNLLLGDRFEWNSRYYEQESPVPLLLANMKDDAVHGAAVVAVAERLLAEPRYKKVMIFVNNAGFDVVLCTLPLARFLIKLGAAVVLAANTYPASDDITCIELEDILNRASALDHTIAAAKCSGRLSCVATGTNSVCINLFRVDKDLARVAEDVDLLFLLGAGRALHTNLNTPFSCDTVKAAYIKDPTIAKMVGHERFSAFIRFEPAAAQNT